MQHLRRDGTLRPDGRTDFRRALTPGAWFESADGPLHVRPVLAGELLLPSGRIIATDPCYLSHLDDTPPFVRTVPPGRYPVWLAMARLQGEEPTFERVACLVLQLRESSPARWELALRPEERLADLALGHFYGHGVDSGNACFVDAAAVEALNVAARGTLYEEGVIGRYERDEWRSRAVDVSIGGAVSANLIACSSGYGDGCYPSWWGFDEAGNVCALATDFFLLVEDFVGEARFPLRDWADRTLIHPDLPRIGARVRLSAVEPDARTLRVVIDGNESCEVALVDSAGKKIVSGGSLRVCGERFEHCLRADAPLSDDAVLVLTYALGLRGL